MRLQNIHNINNKIYLFKREDTNTLTVREVHDFFPYYYEPDPKGTVPTYDGKFARKVTLNNPKDVAKNRSAISYESDVLYTKRYLIDCVPVIDWSPTKYIFLDIEILTKEFPDVKKADKPISCITIWVSSTREYYTWYLGEWGIEAEYDMLHDFVESIRDEQPDVLCAWNIDFDYTYIFNRLNKLSNVIFSDLISPISASRPGHEETYYPAGISIVDMLGLYQKLTLGKKRSYALDYIAQEDLGEQSWPETGFDKLDDTVKAKNQNDVRRMVSLEDKFKVIVHFDGIRRFTKCLWEDLPSERREIEGKLQTISNNSKPLDMVFLQEAHDSGIVLPRKQQDASDENTIEGAFRDSYAQGVFYDVSEYDLSGAYLYAAIDMCLDSSNILPPSAVAGTRQILSINVTDRKTQDIKETYKVLQNPEALIPKVLAKLVNDKNKLRDLTLKNKNDENLEQEYKSKKGLVLSAWGVLVNRYFRLFDTRVGSMITSIVRDLMHYVKVSIEAKGFTVVKLDTDSFFVRDGGKDISELLNSIIKEWSLLRFGKVSQITFELKGHFSKLLLLTNCRHYGYLEGRTKPEIKGVEIKRSGSSKYEANFQRQLFEHILNGEHKESIVKFVRDEMERIKTLPIQEIAFPAKLQSDYEKSNPIHNRAADNTKDMFKDFRLAKGDLFYFTFIEPIGTDTGGKPRDVLAFTMENNTFSSKKYQIKVDWDRVIERNILNKVDTVFEIMNWGDHNVALQGQLSLW